MNSNNKQTIVYTFTNDLRLNDNQLFNQACLLAKSNNMPLLCLYCLPDWSFPLSNTGSRAIGNQRFQFLVQTVKELKQNLQTIGLSLVVRLGLIAPVVNEMINDYSVSDIFFNQSAGFYERAHWQALEDGNPNIEFHTDYLNSLFSLADLPFTLTELPKHFTPFRKQVEALRISKPRVYKVNGLVQNDIGKYNNSDQYSQLIEWVEPTKSNFKGGEQSAFEHLSSYFNSQLPSNYKQVRNHMMGWENSTKFSPWLALGCVSPQQIMQKFAHYESENGANDSTYWIYFELLWREFFSWNAIKQGSKLFFGQDQTGQSIKDTSVFKSWAEGNTGEPLIDACMRELKITGYLSNRGRQIAASYFIHELKLDWRLGASYFEKLLLDYDVASNWGNWQYIAGVGADPRGGRHFNVQKQQLSHDPEGHYRRQWSSCQSGEKDILWSDLA